VPKVAAPFMRLAMRVCWRFRVVPLDLLPIVLTVATAVSPHPSACTAPFTSCFISRRPSTCIHPFRYLPPPTLLSRHAPSREHPNLSARSLPPRRCFTFETQAGYLSKNVGRNAGGVASITLTTGSVRLREAISEFDFHHTIATARPSIL
jgi:hypothetical protein